MRFDKEYQRYLRGECKNYNQSLISALEAMEKGEEETMKDNNDQCEMCGAARVSGSRLCVGCLIKRLDAEMAENLIKRQVIESLKRKNEKLKELVERLLDHITQQAAYGDELQQTRYLKWLEREEGGYYAKGRIHNNK